MSVTAGEDEQRFSYVERIASLYGFQTYIIQRLRSDMGISPSVKGISCTRVISDFHSKIPDLIPIIFYLSKVTLPDE